MKKDQKINKKLTPRDYERMWGEVGPYSQVRLCEETRILDDRVSRVFLVVEASINPFTFEYIQKRRSQFLGDEPVLQLLDYAEYRDQQFGYVVSAGEVELEGEESKGFARKQADMTIQTLIRMHEFVMDKCGLGRDSRYGVVKDKTPRDNRFVWNDAAGRAEPVSDELWDDTVLVGSPAGVQNNKVRFFIILAFDKGFDFKQASALVFAKTLKMVAMKFNVEIENAETFKEYAALTAFLPFDVVPASFIEAVITECVMATKRPIFQKDYFVTNVQKPTLEQIAAFLHQLPRKE